MASPSSGSILKPVLMFAGAAVMLALVMPSLATGYLQQKEPDRLIEVTPEDGTAEKRPTASPASSQSASSGPTNSFGEPVMSTNGKDMSGNSQFGTASMQLEKEDDDTSSATDTAPPSSTGYTPPKKGANVKVTTKVTGTSKVKTVHVPKGELQRESVEPKN